MHYWGYMLLEVKGQWGLLLPHHSGPVTRDFKSSILVEALLWGCPNDHWSIQSKCQQVIFQAQVGNRWPFLYLWLGWHIPVFTKGRTYLLHAWSSNSSYIIHIPGNWFTRCQLLFCVASLTATVSIVSPVRRVSLISSQKGLWLLVYFDDVFMCYPSLSSQTLSHSPEKWERV